MVKPKQPRLSEELIAAAEAQIVEQSRRIDFYITEYSIELLATKMQNGDFEVPAYQREFTWEEKRRHRFIESLLMGLPIPFLFFWENPENGKLEIVDGSQRLRTIQEFILGDLKLGDLNELSLLTGFRFRDLPESRQRKLKNRSIRGIVLNEHTDESSRYDLFDRINTGSKNANAAEVRRGAMGGPFLDLVIELAKLDLFIKLAPISEKQLKEREREELITRFFAYGDGLDDYHDRVSPFLFDYTKKMNTYFTQHPHELQDYRQRFIDTMSFVARNFPLGFRRTPSGKATPRARFEAIAIGSYWATTEKPDLMDKDVVIENWLHSEEFKEVTGSDGANVISKLRNRIEFVRNRLLEAYAHE
ncbi:MAG: DUF262 domain-containing protein [Candidatus Viridilinea halotolerans]|uniref:DUF262 domain-containing protein n=1 Tax=Candidatus Viridilinea halotolerans TaxID=2491704 RepID=A0A426TVX3_9CHLR|nr:MAG: DUF262 domain-containing protein [Candidatus Viridilinea halotolerans]